MAVSGVVEGARGGSRTLLPTAYRYQSVVTFVITGIITRLILVRLGL